MESLLHPFSRDGVLSRHGPPRGWLKAEINRMLYLVILSQLFCARVCEKYSMSRSVTDGELLTTEQVHRALKEHSEVSDHPRRHR